MSVSPPTGPAASLRRRIRRWADTARLLRAVAPALLVGVIALHLAVGLLPIAFILATSHVIAALPDALASPAGQASARIGTALLLAMGAFVLHQLLAPFQTLASEMVCRQVDGVRIADLMTCTLTRLPVADLERQEVLDTLAEARSGFDRISPTPGDAAAGTLALLARYGQLAGATAMVTLVLGPLSGFVVAATALVIRHGQRGSLGKFGARRAIMTGRRRRLSYLRRTATSAALAKEARMLGLVPWLRERHGVEARGYLEPLWAIRRELLLRPFVTLAAVGLAGGGTALALLGRGGAEGDLSLLQLAAALQAVLIPLRFGVFFPESDMQTLYGLTADDALRELEQKQGPTDDTEPLPEALTGAVRFERVDFRYQPDAPDILTGLDLELAPGRSTAIVGLNGAGKTTLVKLLTRIHAPTGGRITVGGTNLQDLPAPAWHRRIAVIFQDFTRLQLTAAQNIALGRPDLLHDTAALREAASRAGVTELLDGLANGLDTVLSAEYEGGTDLSGGQWQRIALARALLALDAGAQLLVLDEPTAQLDVRAEAAFFDRFLELTQGVTSVIIAHRFSSVRRADRIVVLADGEVAESGTHQELMDLDGRYAELFRTQAERFTAGTAPRAAGQGASR